jgi:hypothetical protein
MPIDIKRYVFHPYGMIEMPVNSKKERWYRCSDIEQHISNLEQALAEAENKAYEKAAQIIRDRARVNGHYTAIDPDRTVKAVLALKTTPETTNAKP